MSNLTKIISLAKVLERAARQKKDKYLDVYLSWQRSFMAQVYLVNEMDCKEAKKSEKRIALVVAKKWERPYSKMDGYVRGRFLMAVKR